MDPADVEIGNSHLLPEPGSRAARAATPASLVVATERYQGISFRGASAGPFTARRPSHRPSPAARRVARPPIDEDDERFVYWLLEQAGLSADCYRVDPLIRRLAACLRALRVDSVASAWDLLESRPARLPVALDALLIGTTELFRDAAVFHTLADDILPAVIARTAEPRIWSAGCSDGAEIYSVAMLLAKAGVLDASYLLGTDCRVEAISSARDATYVWRPFPPGLAKWWQPLPGGRVVLAEELRRAVKWQLSDLMAAKSEEACQGKAWDMILCRNLAIYLKPDVAGSLWDRLALKLAPGGYLVVGKAEKPRSELLRRVAPSIYCRCNPRRTHL